MLIETGCIGSSEVEVSECSLGEMSLLVKAPDSFAAWAILTLIAVTSTSSVGMVDAELS